MSRLLIDVESRTGTKTGVIANAFDLQFVESLSLCGVFSFLMPGTDPRRSLLAQKTAQVRIYIDSAEVFLGIVESLRDSIGQDGAPVLEVGGRSKLVELAEATTTDVFSASTIPHSSILAQSAGPWTIDTTNGVANITNAMTGSFFRETILLAATRIVALTGSQFVYKPTLSGADRKIIWLNSTGTDSGIRAVAAVGDTVHAEGNPNICYIQRLERVVVSPHVYTVVAPYGSGEGEARLTIKASTVTPTGYTINKTNNSITHDANEATYGSLSRTIQFKEITPISNTTADLQAAANMLVNATVRWLERYSQPHTHYTLDVFNLPASVIPGQTVRVVYDNEQYSIDTDLKILEIRTAHGADGLTRKSLLVADTDVMPDDSSTYQVGDLEQGNIYMSHPQMNANTYTTGYRVPVDDAETGEVNFFFGDEVAQLQQVVFRFKINSLVSTVRTVGGSSTTTGASSASTTASDGSSTPTSANASSTTTTSSGGNHVHTVPIVNSSGGSTVQYNSGGGYLETTGGGTFTSNNTNVDHTHTLSHTHDVTIAAHTHGMPHTHDVTAAISATYGVYKDSANKFALRHLSWRVNSSGGFTPFEVGITGVTNAGGGYIEVTTDKAHNLTNGDTVYIASTTDYNGEYTVSSVAATTFRVVDTYVSSQTGKARTVADKSDGAQFWQLDITSRVQDSTNFRPNQENNLLEIQDLTMAISSISGTGTVTVDTVGAHGLTTGMSVSITGTTNFNTASRKAVTVTDTDTFTYSDTGHGTPESAGTVTVNGTASIDGFLNVRNIIQSIAYT